MYEQYVGKIVKVVYKDGERFSVSQGLCKDYNSKTNMVSIFDDEKQRLILINIICIMKFEVFNDG